MKSFKYSLIIGAFVSVALVGCLKDDAYDKRENQAAESHEGGKQNVVSIALTATTTGNHLQLAFAQSSKDTTFNAIPVSLGGQPATEDIQVTLMLNPALLGSYNADNGTAHEQAPSNLYTILNPGSATAGYVVTIPKGANTGYLQVKLKPSNFLGFDYALGMQISSVTSGYLIASNLSTGILAIGVKNQWDGIYSYKGFTLRAGDASLTGNFFSKEMTLITKGATSVGFGSAPLWGDGNSGIAIGNPVLTFDPTGTPPYPVTIYSPEGAKNAPGYNSRYDPTTKTFYISMTWGAGPASRLSTDTLTYLRSR